MSLPPPPRAAGAARLRALFDEAGYSAERLRDLLRPQDEALFRRADLVVHERRLAGDESPLATLARLFLLGRAVDAGVAEGALGDCAAALVESGFAEERGGELHARVRVVPHDRLLIASDREGAEDADLVPGVHRPSALLGSLTIRRPVARALDVGTGNGIQALLVAPIAERVVATDVSERALAFAELNASLNGVENVRFRLGSFLEPVEGERYGLVVANPPYVISPENAFVFRDAGLGRDRVSEQLVRAVPSVMDEGAFASVLVSWVAKGEDDAGAPATWVEGLGCDAWILHTGSDDPLSAAAAWNRDLRGDDHAFGVAVDRWLDYFRAEHIEGIAYGGVVLRRRDGASWTRSSRLPMAGVRRASDHLRRLFDGHDWLLAHDSDDALAAARLRPSPDLAVEETRRPGAPGLERESAELVLRDGLAFRAGLDAAAVRLVEELATGITVGEAVAAAAAAEGLGADEAASGLALARAFVGLGFFVPANDEGAARAAPSGRS